MRSKTERHGQTEIGIVAHHGQEFAAIGASVVGRNVTGYLNDRDELTTWNGRVMLAGRSYRTGTYRTEDGETFGIVFPLANGRAIVGYSLGDGMLFRGELVYAHQDADSVCRQVCEWCLECDAEDAEQFDD